MSSRLYSLPLSFFYSYKALVSIQTGKLDKHYHPENSFETNGNKLLLLYSRAIPKNTGG